MNTFDQEIIKTLELIAYKLKESEMSLRYSDESESEPLQIEIYEEDLKPIDMNRYNFCSALEHLSKKGYLNIEFIQDPSKFDYEDVDPKNIVNGHLRIAEFGITVSTSVDKVIENYKKGMALKEIGSSPRFDGEKSILYIDGFEVKIARQNKTTNEHKILKYIFIDHKDNINNEFDYSEIAEEEFEGLVKGAYLKSKDGWKRYQSACKAINEKISVASDNKIKQFLLFNSAIDGSVRINPEYLMVR